LRPFCGVHRIGKSDGEENEVADAVKLGGEFDIGLEAVFRFVRPLGNFNGLEAI
jgi:hypothetical protein